MTNQELRDFVAEEDRKLKIFDAIKARDRRWRGGRRQEQVHEEIGDVILRALAASVSSNAILRLAPAKRRRHRDSTGEMAEWMTPR
jgi:hypothetical protein